MNSRLRPLGCGARARREPSLRKAAREHYLASAPAFAEASAGEPAAPNAAADASADTALSERVRALYEGSVVPVREIARLAGVSERTIYKYVRKGGWRRRHAGPARDLPAEVLAEADAAVAAAAAADAVGGAETAGPGFGLGFAPVKGAGGRFIRREDKDLPQARGLKALDPPGAQRAAAACVAASVLADQAATAAAAAARAQRLREQATRDAQVRMRTFERL